MVNDILCYKVDNAIDFLIDSQEKYFQYKRMVRVCLKALLIKSEFSIRKLYSIKTWSSSKCLDDNLDTIIDSYYMLVYFSMRNKRSPKLIAQYLIQIIEKNRD